MTRLHQLNSYQYPATLEADIQLSLQTSDALLLIEEAVLRALNNDSLLEYAAGNNIPVYLLESDAQAHGILASEYELISAEKWLQLTAQYQTHLAW